MLRKSLLALMLNLIPLTSLMSQEGHFTGNIIIKSLIEVVDTTNNCVVYYKKMVKTRIDGKKIKEPKFYISIPKGLSFHSYTKQGGSTTVYFSNDRNEIIAVAIGRNRFRDKRDLAVAPFWQIEDKYLRTLLQQGIAEIKIDSYVGSLSKGRYLVYYYNVEEDDIELFNRSISSIRKSPS